MKIDIPSVIDYWIEDVRQNLENLKPDEIEEIIFKINNLQLDDIDPLIYDEKENKKIEKQIKTNDEKLTIEKIDEILDNSSIDEAIENIVKFDKNNKDLGKTEFWRFNDKENKIEKRLQPQKFHHHSFKPSFFKTSKGEYFYDLNFACPNSGTDSDLENYGLLRNEKLKENAMTCRFKRKNKFLNEKVDYLCRMCPFIKWIPIEKFGDHLGLAHGIIKVENLGLIALPPPVALYKQTLGRLKFYYSKCPKCSRWIRLGKMAEVKTVCKEVEHIDSINRNTQIVGLYTNYFYHFMECSLI
jgi:hypothetical protein